MILYSLYSLFILFNAVLTLDNELPKYPKGIRSVDSIFLKQYYISNIIKYSSSLVIAIAKFTITLK